TSLVGGGRAVSSAGPGAARRRARRGWVTWAGSGWSGGRGVAVLGASWFRGVGGQGAAGLQVVQEQAAHVPDVRGHGRPGGVRVAGAEGVQDGGVVLCGRLRPALDGAEEAERYVVDRQPQERQHPGRARRPVDRAVDLVVEAV